MSAKSVVTGTSPNQTSTPTTPPTSPGSAPASSGSQVNATSKKVAKDDTTGGGRIEKFDGMQNPRRWCGAFERLATIKKWDDQLWTVTAASYLRGEARAWGDNEKVEEMDWKTFQEELAEHFHPLLPYGIIQSKLVGMKKSRQETMLQFAQRLKTVAAQCNTEVQQSHLIEVFIRGIPSIFSSS